jgi:hypothetical protein
MTALDNQQRVDSDTAALDRTRASAYERLKLCLAFWLAIAALVALILIVAIGAARWSAAKDVGAVISPVAGVVGTIVGAYLGHQAGSAGRERAAADNREQTRIACELAAVADREDAARILGLNVSPKPGASPDPPSGQ